MHNLDDLLAGRDGFGYRLAGRLFLHRFDEIARDGKGYIRLKQRNANFAQSCLNVVLRQRALFGEAIEYT
jgi:hypothetical protein